MSSEWVNDLGSPIQAVGGSTMGFLKSIVGSCTDTKYKIEIRSKKAGGGMDVAFFDVTEIFPAAFYALQAGVRSDTYVGMAVRNCGSADAVDFVHQLWADCDTDEALDKLAAFRPAPSFTVRSGGLTERGRSKLHAYWALRHPLRSRG